MMARINILHLRSSGGFFGAEGVILNLAKDLAGLSCNSLIVCLNNKKNPHTELLAEARKFGLLTESVTCRMRFDLRAIFEIRQLIKKNRIQILHCHDYKSNLYGLLASRFLNIKLISTHHLWTHETLSLRIYEFLDGILTNFFDKVIAVSDEVRDEVSNFCINKTRLTTIYNGIDLAKYSAELNGRKIREEFKIPNSYRIVGSVGRLTTQKGFDYLLEAAKGVIEDLKDVVFLIVGSGNLKIRLEAKAQRLGLKNRVIFTDKRDDMADIYSSMDIFVLPSIREGLPLALLEAMAMKKPVIASNVGGISNIISSNTGILLNPKDANGLSGAIIGLLKDSKKSQLLTVNARRLVEEKFSSVGMAKEYSNIYRELFKRGA